jgi:hypothetical protein
VLGVVSLSLPGHAAWVHTMVVAVNLRWAWSARVYRQQQPLVAATAVEQYWFESVLSSSPELILSAVRQLVSDSLT